MCYALGGLSESDRFEFEVRMERDTSLQRETVRRLETVAESLLTEPDATPDETTGPGPGVRQRVLQSIDASIGIDALMSHFATAPGDCIVVTDMDSRITWVNAAFSKMCGYSLGELQGRKPAQLLHGPRTSSRALRRLGQAIRSLKVRTEDVINYHKDGHPYWVRMTISPVVDTNGDARGFISIERELVSKPPPRR